MMPSEDTSHRLNGAHLAASFPLDPERGLRGNAGAQLVDHVLGLMERREARQRRLSEGAAKKRRHTVEVLLSNLATAALNRLNPRRYVAVPFSRNAYPKLGLSCDAISLARDALQAADLIELVPGFHDPAYLGFIEAGRVSRLRVAPPLRDLFDRLGVGRQTVALRREKLVRIKHPKKDAGPEPLVVTTSREVLARINSRIDAHEIDLPEDAWQRLANTAAEASSDKENLPFVGDPTAKALYRVFTGQWNRGGRLYGAWWLNIPKRERRHLTIEGEPTVEIDYGHIHPALLYNAMSAPLNVDPYDLPPYSRALCKETFQRLINSSPQRGGADLKRPKDHAPPADISFSTFIVDYKRHLHGVAAAFGKSVGLLLQYEDSNLALAILEAMERQEIVTLPIHDSFIVKARHESALHLVMRDVYRTRYAIEPSLKVSYPPTRGARPGHY